MKLEELHADTEPSAADDQILALLRDALEQVIDSARPAITNSRAQDTSELDEVIPALDKYRSFFAKATALLGEIVEYNGPRPEAGKSESTNALLKQFVESEGEYVRKLLMVAKVLYSLDLSQRPHVQSLTRSFIHPSSITTLRSHLKTSFPRPMNKPSSRKSRSFSIYTPVSLVLLNPCPSLAPICLARRSCPRSRP